MYAKNLIEVDFNSAKTLMPPQNVDAEEAVLGAILLDPDAIDRVVDILRPEAFYVIAHRDIYKAMLCLHEASRPVDLMMVATWLYDHDSLERVGGQGKLAELVDRTVSSINVDRHALLLMDKYQRRRLIKAGNEIVELGYEVAEELPEVINQAEQKVFNLTQSDEITPEAEEPIDILLRIYDGLTQSKTKGLPSGVHDLDSLTGGFKRKKLYVIAGRSGMGKTQMAVNVSAYTLVKQKAPVVFFSAEMDRDELMTRVLAWESGVDSKKIEEGTISDEADFSRLQEAISRLSGIPLWLDDTSGSSLTPSRIRSVIRRATKKYGKPGLVVLDYLQLLGDDSGKANRVTELDGIAKACKNIAKEFDIPFIALAQINRATESQNNKRPSISQLRESGAIEQAADVIVMIYRDDYYNPESTEKGICELIVGKQRGGPTGTVKAIFQPETSHFLNIAKREF